MPPALPDVLRTPRQQYAVEPRVKEQKWPGTVMALSIFIALFTLLWLGNRTLVDLLVLLRALAVCCVAGNVLPYAWSGLRLGMEKLEWFFFNLLSIGPLTVCLLLMVNHYVHGPVVWGEGRIGQAVTIELPWEMDEFLAVQNNITLSADFFAFTDEERDEAVGGRFRAGVAKGCLGYWSVTDVEVVR